MKFTPQIWGANLHKSLVLQYFFRHAPQIRGVKSSPPEFGGYGSSGNLRSLASLFKEATVFKEYGDSGSFLCLVWTCKFANSTRCRCRSYAPNANQTLGSCKTWGSPKLRDVKTVLLANGHFAGVAPAIFVIFVDFRGPRSKIPCFYGQNAISEFSPIFVKTTSFRQGTKRPFSKTTVSTTLINPYISNHDISKWHFSTHGAV